MKLGGSKMFWLGFSVAVGGILAVAVAAFGHGGSPTLTKSKANAAAPAPPAGPLVESIAALKAPRTAADVLPASVAATARDLATGQDAIEAGLQLGRFGLDQSRRLLNGVGSLRISLYAFPTSKGHVCTVLSAVYGSAGCTDRFTIDAPIAWDVRDPDALGGGAPAIVDGLVPNDVTSVSVVAGGARHGATLARNAFFYEVAATTLWPDSIVIGYSDGTTRAIDIAPVKTR